MIEVSVICLSGSVIGINSLHIHSPSVLHSFIHSSFHSFIHFLLSFIRSLSPSLSRSQSSVSGAGQVGRHPTTTNSVVCTSSKRSLAGTVAWSCCCFCYRCRCRCLLQLLSPLFVCSVARVIRGVRSQTVSYLLGQCESLCLEGCRLCASHAWMGLLVGW